MQVVALSPSLLFLRITANVRSSSSQDDDAHTSRAATASLGTGRRRSGGVTLALLFLANRRLGISTGFEDICSLALPAPYFKRAAVMSGRGGGCRSWRVSCWADSSPPSLPAAGSHVGARHLRFSNRMGTCWQSWLDVRCFIGFGTRLAVDARADMAYSVSRISSCQASSRPQASWPPASSRPNSSIACCFRW